MYSRNLRGQRERPLQIPDNYGGSFLFPNTRMPNPPPIYDHKEKETPKSSPRRNESTYIQRRTNERTKQTERAQRPHQEYGGERPWYDGNVREFRREPEEFNKHDECNSCDERENCESIEINGECDEWGESDGAKSYDESESCKREKNQSGLPPILSQNFLPLKLSEHFPFGHGLGFEELFLLGLILVLFKEQADEQIIVLLIVLLFCG